MSLIDFNDRSSNLFSGNGQPAAEKKKARFWVNIGYVTTAVREEGGEPEELFVSLPFGIPLDTMSLRELTGGDFKRKLARSQNALLEVFLQKAEELQPGEEISLDQGKKLQIRLRRVQEETEASAGDVFGGFKF